MDFSKVKSFFDKEIVYRSANNFPCLDKCVSATEKVNSSATSLEENKKKASVIKAVRAKISRV